MNLAWVDLADYLTIAGAVLGIDPGALLRYADLHLAESALAAPAASYGGIEFYPAFHMKVAVLGWHLVKNHPLPDGEQAGGLPHHGGVRRAQRVRVGRPSG